MNNQDCNRQLINDFFNADNVGIDANVAEHLNWCGDCREYLNQQAADDADWSEVSDMLKPSEFDSASVAGYSAGGTTLLGNSQSVSVKDVLDSLAPTDDPHRLGRLGTYEISGVVGVGGMGVVLKAVDPTLDRVVAIKVMAPQFANSDKARKRFSREARAAAAVIHPNVIPIHTVDEAGTLPYLVMTYVRGDSLQKRLDRGPLELPEVLRIGSQVAAGLAAAHEQGLVHRDIKPENILLEGSVERVTLTDFGLARAVDDNSITQNGTIAGTPMYMSPEQARGEQVDQQSDLFSLGSVLYALCAGQPPYQAETSYGVMRKIIDERPAPLRELQPGIPEWMARIVDKLMANDKANRFKSSAELHSLLDACLSHIQKPTETVMPPELQMLLDEPAPSFAQEQKAAASTNSGSRSLFGWLATACLALVVAVGAMGGFWSLNSTNKIERAAQNLRAYLQTGTYDDHPLNDIETLLKAGQQGHAELKALDEDFDKIVCATAKLDDNERTVAGIVSENKDGDPELDMRAWSPTYFGGMSSSFGGGLTFRDITIGDGLTHRRMLEYVVSVPPGETEGPAKVYKLEPGGLYRVQVPFIDVLDSEPNWDAAFASAVKIETELLGHGYSREGDHILFDAKRIDDKEGADLFKRVAGIVGSAGPTKRATVVDAASFKALSEEYTKDKNTVFYKWGTLEQFYVVEVPDADPKSFECVDFNLAKDNKHVWFSGKVVPNADPKALSLVNGGQIWKDANSVWYSGMKIGGADPRTFEHLGYGFYRDKNLVYWSHTPLDGADPKTFRSIGDKTGYGADQNSVWAGTKRMPNVDPATFASVHSCVYKDKDGVYCNNIMIPGARTETIRKLADLDDQLSALLTDGESYFIFVSGYKEVYKLEQRDDSLHVSREVWEPDAATVRSSPMTLNKNLGQMGAMLTEEGWKDLKAPGSKIWGETFYDQREAKTLVLFQDRFRKAWEIISGEQKMVASSKEFIERMNTPVGVSYAEPKEDDWKVLRAYRETQREYDGYYRKWLKLNPDVQKQVDAGKQIDVAELFALELFDQAESKLSMTDRLNWKITSLKLAGEMFQLQMRQLRPPHPETPLLRDELIRQAAKSSGIKSKAAEEMVNQKLETWRSDYPEFLWIEPKAEKQLRDGKPVAGSSIRIKTAQELLAKCNISLTGVLSDMKEQYDSGKLNPVQQELLAHLMTAEANSVEASQVDAEATSGSDEDTEIINLIGKFRELDKTLERIHDAATAKSASEKMKRIVAEIRSDLESLAGETDRPFGSPVPTEEKSAPIGDTDLSEHEQLVSEKIRTAVRAGKVTEEEGRKVLELYRKYKDGEEWSDEFYQAPRKDGKEWRSKGMSRRDRNVELNIEHAIGAGEMTPEEGNQAWEAYLKGKKEKESKKADEDDATWTSLGIKEWEGNSTDEISLIQLMNQSRGKWKFAGTSTKGDTEYAFDGEITISGGFKELIELGRPPLWKIGIEYSKGETQHKASGVLLANLNPDGLSLMFSRSHGAGKSTELFIGNWDKKTLTLSLSQKAMRDAVKGRSELAAKMVGDAKFQITFS